MVTIFSIPKAFEGHIGTIQRNAITSWTLLRPRPEIVLFGNEIGTAELVAELGLRHNEEVARNEFDTPLLNYIFAKAQADPRADVLCYVNADIILLQDFVDAVERTQDWAKRFLMVGQCWDTDIAEPLGFDRPGWEKHLRDIVRSEAKHAALQELTILCFRLVCIPTFLHSALAARFGTTG